MKNVTLPMIPKVSCPKCLTLLIPDKYDAEATVTFIHWPNGQCKFDNRRFEVIVHTVTGFAPAKATSSKSKSTNKASR